MRIYEEKTLKSFKFWGGAVDRVKHLTKADFEIIEENLNGLYPDGISEENLNDFIWFEDQTVSEWLGFQNFDEMIEERREEIERMKRDF